MFTKVSLGMLVKIYQITKRNKMTYSLNFKNLEKYRFLNLTSRKQVLILKIKLKSFLVTEDAPKDIKDI